MLSGTIPARRHSVVHKTRLVSLDFFRMRRVVFILKKNFCAESQCGGSSSVCSVPFHRLPRKPLLRKRWLLAIHHDNTPEIANRYVCRQHCRGGRRQGQDDVPSLFIGEKVVKEKTSRTSQSLLRELFPSLQIWNKMQRSVQIVNPATSIPDYFAHEARIAPEVADNVAAAVE